METLTELLGKAQEAYGDRPALVSRSGLRDQVWSYRDIYDAALTVACHLREDEGLQPGERVLVHGPNGPLLVAAYFGCWLARLVLVPMDRYSTRDFVARVASLTEAAAMITSDCGLAPPGVATVGLDERLVRGKPLVGVDPPLGNDVAEIVFSSGTTGQPKGVILTHRNITANVQAMREIFPKVAPYRFLSLLPMSHMLEQTVGLFSPLALGASIYYPVGLHGPAILQRLRKARINAVVAVPKILDLLLAALDREMEERWGAAAWGLIRKDAERLPFRMGRRLLGLENCLDCFVCGGSFLPVTVESGWERLGVRVVQGYGTTECSPIVSANRFDDRRGGCVGWSVPGTSVRLSDAGEILVKGENVTAGYWNNPGATSAVFTDEGWYRTGDLAEMDGCGAIRIKGRSDDLIVLPSGLNVFPEDIEAVLADQPGIAGCVVLNIPDANGTPRLTAVLRFDTPSGAGLSLEAQAQATVTAANARLAPHQRIGAFRIWSGSDFPRTALMKVKRRELSRLIEESPAGGAPVAPVQRSAAIASTGSLEGLLAQVCRLPAGGIRAESDLVLDLGLDSLGCAELAVQIERQLGLRVDEAALIEMRTAGDLIDYVGRGERVGEPLPSATWPLRRPARMARALIQRAILFPAHGFLCRSFQVRGEEHLASLVGPALFIANHTSHLDTLSLLRALPSRVRDRMAIAAAADYFFANRALGAAVVLAINAFPFVRKGPVRASLEHCAELVDEGWSVLIYPEGTRSTTGELLPFKHGVGVLATGLNVPVVPVALRGGHQILPKGAARPSRGAVSVSFGEPIKFPPGTDRLEAVETLHEALSRLFG